MVYPARQRSGGRQQAHIPQPGKRLAYVTHGRVQHVDDGDVQMRLNQPDKGMRSIAGYGDEIRLPGLQSLARGVQRQGRIGTSPQQMRSSVGNLRVLLHQDFQVILIAVCGCVADYLAQKIYGRCGAHSTDNTQLEWARRWLKIPCDHVVCINTVRIYDRDPDRSGFLRRSNQPNPSRDDELGALLEEVGARAAQQLN